MRKLPVLLVAFVISIGVFNAANLTPLLGPLLYTMTPLQRYYATDYLASTWHRNDPAATTETRLLWKTRKGKSELATEQDLIQLPLGQRLGTYSPEPFRVSDQALAEGWTAIRRENPREVKSALLENVFEQQVYDGYPLWRFFEQPALGLAVLFVVWLVINAWRRERWKRNMWNTRGKANLSFWAWSVEVSDQITKQLLPRPKDPEILSVGIESAGFEQDSHRFRAVGRDEADPRTCRGSGFGFRSFDQETCRRPGPCLSHSCCSGKAETGVRLGRIARDRLAVGG
jgi:hypothetical protein